VLALPHGNTTFRTTVVKPFLVPNEQVDGFDVSNEQVDGLELDQNTEQEDEESTIVVDAGQSTPTPVKSRRGRPRRRNGPDVTIFLQDDTQYETSRQAEVVGLLEKGVFEVIPKSKVPQGTRIFNSRFVDEIKNKGTDKAVPKSRLVVQAYNDDEKRLVLTQSPTI